MWLLCASLCSSFCGSDVSALILVVVTCFFWKKYLNCPNEAVVVLQTRSARKTVRGSKTGPPGGPDSTPLGISVFKRFFCHVLFVTRTWFVSAIPWWDQNWSPTRPPHTVPSPEQKLDCQQDSFGVPWSRSIPAPKTRPQTKRNSELWVVG